MEGYLFIFFKHDGLFGTLPQIESPEEEMDVDSLVESLKQRKQDDIAIPTCVSSVIFFL